MPARLAEALRRSTTPLLVLAAGGGLLTAGLGAAGRSDAAVCIAGLTFTIFVLWSAGTASRVLHAIEHARAQAADARRTDRAEARKRAQQQRRALDGLSAGLASADALTKVSRRIDRVARSANRLELATERLPSEVANISTFQAALQPALATMPTLGGWAATGPTILHLVEEVLAAPTPPVVLECGSGTSTVWIASALRRRGDGHVYALEHDAAYAHQTRTDLARHDVAAHATVVDAPLVDRAVSDGSAPWYDTSGLPGLTRSVTLLFVDGPPAATTTQARLPAFELLADRLADDAIIVLDDTHREEEKDIVAAWTSTTIDGRRLEVVGQVSRSTVLRLVRG